MAIDDATPYEDPEGDPMKWTVPMLQDWLKARGLDHSGNKPQLQPRVVSYLQGPPENIPPIQPDLFGSAEDMLEMLKSMVLLVTTLFQDKMERNTADILELRIRLFLTRFHRFDQPMRKKTQKPTWLGCYNFLSLLNIPNAVQEFGPVRRWFEGKWLGERYVSCVKDERSKCPPSNLHYILMRNLHRSKTVDGLLQAHYPEPASDLLGSYTKISESMVELESKYGSRNPLPVIMLAQGRWGLPYYKDGRNTGKKVWVRFLERTDFDPSVIHNGLQYWNYELLEETKDLNSQVITDYAVLLPMIGCREIGVYSYTSYGWSTEMFGDYDISQESYNYLEELDEAVDDARPVYQSNEDGWI